MNRKITRLTVLVFIIAGIVVAIYYSIQYDISCNRNFTTMLSGLWSALATVVLGIIALWQNNQYKKLSDKTSGETIRLQHDLKDLTEKQEQALLTLKHIEDIKYQPMLEKWNITYFGFSFKSLSDCIKEYRCSIQYNYFNMINPEGYSKVSEVPQYNTFGFLIKNVGEKTIRNFRLGINFDTKKYFAFTTFGCDIEPGHFTLVLLINIKKFEGNEQFFELCFLMQNLLGEDFSYNLNLVIGFDERPFASFNGGDIEGIIVPEKGDRNNG